MLVGTRVAALALVGLCAASAAGSGCGVTCTLLPCTGLRVQVQGAVPSSYTVTISADSVQLFQRDCDATSCPGGLVPLSGVAPDTATVTVAWGSQTVAVTVSPAYQTIYPNGRDCGACRTATVVITLQ